MVRIGAAVGGGLLVRVGNAEERQRVGGLRGVVEYADPNR